VVAAPAGTWWVRLRPLGVEAGDPILQVHQDVVHGDVDRLENPLPDQGGDPLHLGSGARCWAVVDFLSDREAELGDIYGRAKAGGRWAGVAWSA
jgi:hypothetical protein